MYETYITIHDSAVPGIFKDQTFSIEEMTKDEILDMVEQILDEMAEAKEAPEEYLSELYDEEGEDIE